MERTTGPNGKVNGDVDTFYVALFAEKECAIKASSSSIGWAVATKPSERKKGANGKESADFFKVVLQPEYMKRLQDGKSPIVSSPYLKTCSNTMEEFKTGRLLKSLSCPIHPCVVARLPKLLYRVVHDKHPGKGLRSRGSGSIKCDSISFMLHFDYHLNWKRRNPSPFMSTTSDCAKAANIAAKYERKGFNDIEVLVIKVDESKWRRESTVWHVRQTARELGLTYVPKKRYFDENEYLIKDSIPASCVTRIGWKEMKADIKAEADKISQSRKRKRSVFESDGRGDETVMSDGRSRRTWGLVENYQKKRCYYTRRGDLK
jgi:hypothetical protein